MLKRFLIYFCLIISTFIFTLSVKAEERYLFHGFAEINEELKEDPEILSNVKGEVQKGTKVSMVVSNILNTESSEEGDEFFAEITNDIRSANGVVIPAGSIAHGSITEITDAKRFNRDATITLNFDYIATPDGREIPVSAKMTTKRNPVKNAAIIAGEHAGYTVAGGAIGGLVALQTLGLAAAVASNGYTVAGGAAIGAVAGLGIAMSRKGDHVLLAPGDEINVKILDNLNLPVFHEKALIEEEIKNDNLLVHVTSVKLEKDPFGEPNTITLGLSIVNKTSKTYPTFDMALTNENRAIYYASPFGDTELWFKKIPPNSRIAGKVSFSVDNPKQKLWLVFFDNYSKKPVVKLSLNNAKRELDLKNKKKKK
ncbi:MAG: hypothetical protein MJ180_04465 [Candidatus Gastranaerophilales bacterium]|nr:hypothetical protein [Candidatus Gastranaerophilales bacterium]